MATAMFYETLETGTVKCSLCPHGCILADGRIGICGTRKNNNGTLELLNYGILSAVSVDPIEKKPLYHYYPGKNILSIGSFGCNLKCKFCQNCNISQVDHHIWSDHPQSYSPETIISKGMEEIDNIGIAYTYNEPTVFYEFMVDCAQLAKEKNLNNIIVSNGYIEQAPLLQLIEFIDAFNIDLKSFNDDFYKKVTGSSLNPVLNTIQTIAESGKHLELTFLVIPGLNDDESMFREMVNWIYDHCNENIVLHISRYYPHFKLKNPPTPIETITKFTEIAKDILSYVYPGNTGNHLPSDTFCPDCGNLLISRSYYLSKVHNINQSGHCKFCNNEIYGNF